MQSQVIRTGRPMIFHDVTDRVRDPRGRYYEVDPKGAVRDLRDAPPPLSKSAIMAPLRLDGAVVGVIQVMADVVDAYGQADLDLLEGIALLLAVALENARLFRRVQDELEERRRAERELRATEEVLRHADRRKDEFLAILGHELRNPLNPIRHAVEVLRHRETYDVDARSAQDMIRRQVADLTRLIDDLLEVSRITQDKLELRLDAVALDVVLAAAADAIRPVLEAAGQTLALPTGGASWRLHADALRLSQVFVNLLDNASKYSAPGSRIEIGTRRDGDAVAITIADQGRGIASEDLARIFELFYQGDSPRARAQGGLGLGLTLVKRLVEQHGGTITAESDGLERGSRFVVRLPLADVAAPEPLAPAPELGRSIGAWRILIADDNHDSADSMAMLLRLHGHEARIAYDGESAWSVACDWQPDVAILDVGMPGREGCEVAARLRAEPWGREMGIIAATGWGQESDRRRSMESGFDVHLVKPVDPAALLEWIGKLGSRARAATASRLDSASVIA
jgi:signal transduction histidine kinase/CheY-like chemotaxis protein